MELTGKLTGVTGLETDVDCVTKPDFSVGLVVVSETTAISPPEGFDVGIAEDRSLLFFDFTPFGGAKV